MVTDEMRMQFMWTAIVAVTAAMLIVAWIYREPIRWWFQDKWRKP